MKLFAALFAVVLVADMVASVDLEDEDKLSFIPIPVLTIINMAIKVLRTFVCKDQLLEVRSQC